MKSNKGFTLIELLAVIVILAIIALIATPIILDVIDTAKQGAKESSALGYIDAVEKQVMINQVDTDAIEIPAGTYDVLELEKEQIGVEVKGEKPTEGRVTIDTKGAVTDAKIKIGDFYVSYNGKKAEANKTAFTYTSANKIIGSSVSGTTTIYFVTDSVSV